MHNIEKKITSSVEKSIEGNPVWTGSGEQCEVELPVWQSTVHSIGDPRLFT